MKLSVEALILPLSAGGADVVLPWAHIDEPVSTHTVSFIHPFLESPS